MVSVLRPPPAELAARLLPHFENLPDEGSQRAIRWELCRLLASYGMQNRALGEASFKFHVATPAELGVIWGDFNPSSGRIRVLNTLVAAATATLRRLVEGKNPEPALVQALVVVVHEAVHAHSPLSELYWPRTYRLAGRVVEEITTEMAARRVVRHAFHCYGFATDVPLVKGEVSSSLRSSDIWIDEMLAYMEVSAKCTRAEAVRDLHTAAVAMRAPGVASATHDGEVVDIFLENLPYPPAARAWLKQEIGVTWGIAGLAP